jgi:hypothetical protein
MVAIYRDWTPAGRLKAVDDQVRFARSLLEGAIRAMHPTWTPAEVRRGVAERIYGGPLPGGD